MESMKQGVVVLGDLDKVLFMNTAVSKFVKMAIGQRQETQDMLEQFLAMNPMFSEPIDYTKTPFLDLKMFDKKVDEEANFAVR